MTDYQDQYYQKMVELLAELNAKLETADLSFTGTDLDINRNDTRYIWHYRDMFKSSSDSDIYVRFTPDSWMIVLDGQVKAGTFAAARGTRAYHRESKGDFVSRLNYATVATGHSLYFPRTGVTEDVAYGSNDNLIGAYTNPYLICAPDSFAVHVSSTVTGEEITTILRAVLPGATKPTVAISAGILGATNTDDYDTATELINCPNF